MDNSSETRRERGIEGGSPAWLHCPLSHAREGAGLRPWDPTGTRILHRLKTKASIYCWAVALSRTIDPQCVRNRATSSEERHLEHDVGEVAASVSKRKQLLCSRRRFNK